MCIVHLRLGISLEPCEANKPKMVDPWWPRNPGRQDTLPKKTHEYTVQKKAQFKNDCPTMTMKWTETQPSEYVYIYIYIKTNTCMPFYIYIIAFSIHKQRNSRLAISCCSLVFTEKSTEKTRLCKLGAPYHPSLAFRPGQQRFRNLWGIRWLPELV